MPDLSVLVKNLEIVLEMIGIHLQRTADIHMESLGKISTNKMVFELDPQHIEKLYLVVMCVLCNHTENKKAAEYIGLINECEEKYRPVLADFLHSKVLKFLEDRGLHHSSDRKNSAGDLDLDRKNSSSSPGKLSNSGVDELPALLHQV
jgi:hypothetical protein